PLKTEKTHKFYFWAGVPIVVAAGMVLLFLRPIYIISACDIYADYVRERGENLVLPPPPRGAVGGDTFAVLVFGILAIIVAAAFVYRQELGIMDLLAR
ncbi:MAG TPA: hypothetical protein DDW67_03645, partial [Elusimicrobia bacterium]|nr:hypothetical protein [Elusimicrobiota bacterium]